MSNDNFYLGGSAFAQIHKSIGKKAPTIKDDSYFKKAFNLIQKLINNNKISSGHDIGSGGLITTHGNVFPKIKYWYAYRLR